MSKIWFTSDWHFCHDRAFVYAPRGFSNVHDMNEQILKNHNALVNPEDEVYVLGDLMLNNNNNEGLSYISQLNGKLHIIRGNHDTNTRIELYKTLPNVISVSDAERIKVCQYHFYCSHYPTLTANFEKESLKQVEINLFGHTHQKCDFYEDRPYMFHVGIDSNHNCPIEITDIVNKCEEKVKECIKQL